MRRELALVVVVLVTGSLPVRGQPAYGLPFKGEEAETFLRTATVVRKKALGVGVTHSDQVTLSDGSRTAKAVWKTIDTSRTGTTIFPGGGFVMEFADTYKYEIAAYELDKLVGLDLVPPTVERTIKDQTGSLQMWVEGVTTEWERRQENRKPPNPRLWNEQMYKVRLLHQLTYNTDYQNIRNVLVDPEFRVYAIDFSRAFAFYPSLLAEKDLKLFSRTALEGLKRLDRPTLDAKLGRWVEGQRIEAILKRRDKILALSARLVKEKGEGAVLYY